MSEINKQISGDWYDIKESFSSYYDLYDFFKADKIFIMDLRPHIEKLKFAVEQGITEYKKIVSSPFFRTMENVKFQSPSIDEIKNQKSFLSGLLFTVLTQRLISTGDIRVSGQKIRSQNNGNSALESMDLKEIFININERIRNNPELLKDHYYKNILMQIPIIKKEKETMKKLLPTIKQESRESFLSNFKNTFSTIESKIKKNYQAIIENDIADIDNNKNILEIAQSKHLTSILLKQGELISKLRSILIFAVEDKYKIRETLLSSLEEKKNLEELINSETDEYNKLLNEIPPHIKQRQNIGNNPYFISRAYCKELIIIFEKDM